MTTFLKIIDPATALFQVINVVSFDEDPTEFRGTARRAFAGNRLSTQRTPKRSWKVTAEFATGILYEQFRTFVSSTDIYGRMIAPKPMQMTGGPLAEDLTPTPRSVDIELGTGHSLGEVMADSGGTTKFPWSLDFTIIER